MTITDKNMELKRILIGTVRISKVRLTINIIKKCPISESVDSSIHYFRQLWREIMNNNERDTSSSIALI